MKTNKIVNAAAALLGAFTLGASLSACGKKPEETKQPEAASAGDDKPKAYITDSRNIPGIGIRIYNDNGAFLVSAVLDDSPASAAFIQLEDQILKIDGKDTSKMSFAQVIEKLDVKDGTKLKLEVKNIFDMKPRTRPVFSVFDVLVITFVDSVLLDFFGI